MNNSGVVVCTMCESGFYLLDNQCNYGASIMCAISITSSYISSKQWGFTGSVLSTLTDFGSCQVCNQSISTPS